MASGSHHCKDCGLYFESARSLEVHLQYHKENLMNMWMGSDERGREGGALAPSPVQGDLTPLGVSSSEGGLVSSSVQSVNAGVSSSSFTVPSPMQYEYKMSPGLQSPQGGVVPQGPPSGHALSVGFPQQSPGGFYPDFGQQHHHQPQQPQQFGGYQIGGFLNGNFDDGFYGRGTNTAPRFHPYMGRSPAPTPSPGNPHNDIKEEMPSADTPEILDLDSQKVLGSSGVPQQQPQPAGSLPPMWRPHEQFPSTSGLTMGGLPLQQPGFPGPPAPPQHIPGLGGGSSYLSGGGGSMGGYHPQGMTNPPQAMSSPTSMFGAPPPSPRETAPPSEFASNVKRPKSFKCEDCNKWFTSHGHLKRHYNTTLHKNMTKLNGNSASRSTPDPTRPPILSPGAKSIGEASNLSSQDEESNLSATDALETPPPPPMQQPPPAYNPPPTSLSGYQPPGVPGPSQGLHAAPQFSQAPHFLGGEQPPTAPTLYHGHFSTNPTGFGSQPPASMGGGPPFYPGSGNNNFGGYQTQGGHQGPGFHSMNDFPGQSLDGFSSFKLDNDRGASVLSRSPEPAGGDTGSEASMDSSESGGTTSSITTEGSFRCQDCGKMFNRMCYLTQHRTTYHEGEKPFKCGTCGKRFPDELTFSDHQSKHAGEKPYKCEVCPKQFNHKTDLRRHMCLHTGEKPFTCEQCGKGFIRKDHMLKHFQTHRKKAMAAAASGPPSHPPGPPMNHGPPGFPGHHPGHRPGVPHGAMAHPGHGPPGHPGHPPHVVAPPVY
ncbi:protein glass-like [Homarus americanus]|uniref:protein glass-like n=1 Tax=Homarus americanus TaxID=6706 RepID=UPI001C43F031|nr:protein glass-like [Homarus americanus]